MEEGIITNIDEFVRKLLIALNDCGIDYMLIGGVAAVHYGRARSTGDCDIVLSIEESQIKKFCEHLQKHGFTATEQEVTQAFKEKSHFNAYYKGQYGYRADFSWRSNSLAEYGFQRAQKKDIFGVIALVEQPEDIIIAKLVYGAEQDFDDAQAIFLRQDKLDKIYMKKRAEEEGVRKKLDRLFESAK